MILPGQHEVEILHGHICCGIGAGARGFNRAGARVGNLKAKFVCVGGIDVDPRAVADFERLTGTKGTVLDLFSRDQYIAFWGHEPPADWREATPDDIRRAFGYRRPHIIFISAPCKGFSGLLAESMSKTAKYQALNKLAERAMWLVSEAYADDPVELIIFENVPRIATRGRPLLDRIGGILRYRGYAIAETFHDCGEIGGLAQTRKRFLMVARHMAKVPNFLYEPAKKRLRGVGEVLDKMPMPGDPLCGPMHRVPALQWKTWVRLAFVEAGGDWRSLNKLQVEDGYLKDYALAPIDRRSGFFGVNGWTDTAPTVAGETWPTNGSYSVADPRARSSREGTGFLGTVPWGDASGTITGDARPSKGPFTVADPRYDGPERRQFGVNGWEDVAPTLTGQRSPGQGYFSVADPRVDGHEKSVQQGVRGWKDQAPTVTGNMAAGAGQNSIADPRAAKEPNTHKNVYRVVRFDKPAGTIGGGHGPSSGGQAVADPRLGEVRFNSALRVVASDAPSPAVAGPGGPAGGLAVADPRPSSGWAGAGKYRVTRSDEASGAVVAASTTGNGAFCVADPRCTWNPGAHQNKLAVTPADRPARTITGASGHGMTSGMLAVADPRPDCLSEDRGMYLTGGHYGVVAWDENAGAVSAHPKNNNGAWSVADPRELPALDQRLVALIISDDGTWHRPFTTMELAALQSLFDPEEDFVRVNGVWQQRTDRLFTLEGNSDSRWREGIGNAVPSDGAEGMAEVMGRTLLLAWSGETFTLSNDPIWVQPITMALAVAQTEAAE